MHWHSQTQGLFKFFTAVDRQTMGSQLSGAGLSSPTDDAYGYYNDPRDPYWSLLTLWALGWGTGDVPPLPPPDVTFCVCTLTLIFAVRLQHSRGQEAAARGDAATASRLLLPVFIPFLASLSHLLCALLVVSACVLACQVAGPFTPGVRPAHVPLNIARTFLLSVCTHAPTALLLRPVVTERAAARAFRSSVFVAAPFSALVGALSIAFWDVDGADAFSWSDLSASVPRVSAAAAYGAVAAAYGALLAAPLCSAAPQRLSLRPYAWCVFLTQALVAVGLLASAWGLNVDNYDGGFSVVVYDAVLLVLLGLGHPLCLYAALAADTAFWRGELRTAGTPNVGAGVGSGKKVTLTKLLWQGAVTWGGLLSLCFRGSGQGVYGTGLRALPQVAWGGEIAGARGGGGDAWLKLWGLRARRRGGGGGGGAGDGGASASTPLLPPGSASPPTRRASRGHSFSGSRPRAASLRGLSEGGGATAVVVGGAPAPPESALARALHLRELRSWVAEAVVLRDWEDSGLVPALMALQERASEAGALLHFAQLRLVEVADQGAETAVYRGTYAGPVPGTPAAVVRAVAVKVYKPFAGLGTASLAGPAAEAGVNLALAAGGARAEAARARLARALASARAPSAPPPPPLPVLLTVPFLGLCYCPPDLSLVSAWCPGGTLRGWLEARGAGGGALPPLVPVRYVRAEGGGALPPALTSAAVRGKCALEVLPQMPPGGEPGGWVVGSTAAEEATFPWARVEEWCMDDVGGLDACWRWRPAVEASAPERAPAPPSPFALQRLAFAHDAAAALALLHAFAPPFAHRDVKSPNFFIAPREKPPPGGAAIAAHGAPLAALLGDFGDARWCPRGTSFVSERGTMQWMAPEVRLAAKDFADALRELRSEGGAMALGLAEEGEEEEEEEDEEGWAPEEADALSAAAEEDNGVRYDLRADVYSLAVVVWELLVGDEPFEGMRIADRVAIVLQHHARPPLPPATPRALQRLLRAGWHPDPAQRPAAAVFVRVLQRMLAAARGVANP